MLELYAFISLLGLGYLLSKKTTIPQNANMRINQNEMPSQNNIYDSNYQDAVNRLEAIKAQQSFRKSENPNTNRVINRQYRDQRDDASEKKTFKSALSGMEIPQSDFVHNNMTPFFGSRVKQNVEPVANRSVLEKFTGEFTPDIYRKKREQKPLFDPMQKDVGRDTWGSKNTNDYFQDRIVEPRIRNNERPFDPQYVGPGLNRGYGAAPEGGFQQFDLQDLAKPKTVDELRQGSNPKETYEGRVLPGAGMYQRGKLGEVKKNKKVVTFYENSPERYFTTIGAVTKESERPEQLVKDQNRQDTTKEYAGDPTAAGFSKGPTMDAAVKEPFRQQLEDFGFRNVDGEDYGNGDEYDFGKANILCTENERDLTVEKTYEGNLTSLVKSIIAPLEDIFRFSRKEYTVQNPRLYGQFQATFPAKITIKDPNDVMRTTIKETNIHDTTTGNLKGAVRIAVYNPDDIAKTTIRETTRPMDVQLNIGGGNIGMKGTVPVDDKQKTTMKETLIDGERYGNMDAQERTHGGYQSTEYDARVTQKQFTSDVDYTGIANRKQDDGYLVANNEVPITQKQFLSDIDRYGGAGTTDAKAQTSMEDYMNAEINELREPTLVGRDPTKESVKVAIGKDDVNQTTRKLEIDEFIEREANNMDRIYSTSTNVENDGCGTRQRFDLENDDRIDINILSALKTNPYALKPMSAS